VKKIIIITQWFDPEPTLKGLKFASELSKLGFEVQVITGFPNYPGGKIYSGYKVKFLQREFLSDIIVNRIPLYPSHGKSILGRILNYLSFSFCVFIYGLYISKNADILYVYHPPLSVGVAACFIKIFRKTPIVYDIQDIWPDSLHSTGVIRNKYILDIISYLCNFVYRNVNSIVVLSPGFKKLLMMRGVSEKKISIIYNWTNEEISKFSYVLFPKNISGSERITIMYAGNIGRAQALETIIDAACILINKLADASFIVIGSGVELASLKQYAVDKQAKNVHFFPSVPMDRVNEYLKSADILLVHLKADPLFKITIPSKTQAYMAVGKPILMAVEGDAARLVKSAKCGITARSEDPQDIADKIMTLASLNRDHLERLGQNGMIYYQTNLSFETGVRKFAKIFHSLTK